ncbi:MAG: acyl carrier protein phosphodiesterase [Psychroflexus sp.]|nr:acyl carrier protein phosphodiesterase [Psychroflexus sp.]MDR9449535.1 acyl carrier protein phosphodiesterase [Psychroflexus sp.]
MNYLAHLYLSGQDKEVMLGNFMADMVSKNDRKLLNDNINKGIALHYKIDDFTDQHAITRHSRMLFFNEFRHYSRVIIDVLYDHFLAKNWQYYHPQPLSDFVEDFYVFIDQQKDQLPTRVQRIVPIMIEFNWLYNYSTIDGIISILAQMSRRIKGDVQMDKCLPLFLNHYQTLEKDFTAFFVDIQLDVSNNLNA